MYTGKDPLKCEKCNGEMLLYKVLYRNREGELEEYGGLEVFLRKIIDGSDSYYEQKEKKEKAWYAEKKNTGYGNLCLC